MTLNEKKQLRAKIDLGLKTSIRLALEEHARAGRKVTIWRNGRVVQLIPPVRQPAESFVVREEPPET